jgi:hypothetical protein
MLFIQVEPKVPLHLSKVMSIFREYLQINTNTFLICTYTKINIGNGPYMLVDTNLHVLSCLQRIHDNSIGGMFLMKFVMASFS